MLVVSLASHVSAEEFPVEGRGASGRPGDRVFLELIYDYGEGFAVIVEDFEIQYPHDALMFLPDASTIDLPGTRRNLREYADTLRQFAATHQGNVLENLDPILSRLDRKGYFTSFYTLDGTPDVRSGKVLLKASFDILPTAKPGSYQVAFTEKNLLVDEFENEFSYPSSLQSLGVNVLAIPEPQIALMLLPGLALVTLYARRRARVRR